MELQLTTLLQEISDRKGSDLHLVVGQPPLFRIDGKLTRREERPILDGKTLTALLLSHVSQQQHSLLDMHQDVLLTIRHGNGVFRVNIFHEQGRLGAAIRMIPTRVPTLEELGLTADTLTRSGEQSILHALTKTKRGLILVVGNTGSGKSTLVAAMLEEINRTRSERILTIEQPIEYIFQSKESIITQRTVGEDISDFGTALRSAMRADPDVVFVGQSSDIETLGLSLAVANTGHLVYSVLHGDTTSEAIQRIIESFLPGQQQATARRLLARNLVAVVAQKLIPRNQPTGRLAVQEIMIVTPRIKQMILDGQEDFTVGIEAGRNIGMQTMDDAVAAAYERGDISYEMALFNVSDRERIPASVA